MLSQAITADPVYEFAAEVRAGLSRTEQKELPLKYLYDDVGSALFEVISQLPEYGLTRADERLLRRHAESIVRHIPGKVTVAELGSGSGKKTRSILEALGSSRRVWYCPIEILVRPGHVPARVGRHGFRQYRRLRARVPGRSARSSRQA